MQEYNINNYLDGVKKIGMCGHIRPDGDCVGSCLGLYTYLKNNYSEIDVDLYLEPIADKFKILNIVMKLSIMQMLIKNMTCL